MVNTRTAKETKMAGTNEMRDLKDVTTAELEEYLENAPNEFQKTMLLKAIIARKDKPPQFYPEGPFAEDFEVF
jgi:hypothetical protein